MTLTAVEILILVLWFLAQPFLFKDTRPREEKDIECWRDY